MIRNKYKSNISDAGSPIEFYHLQVQSMYWRPPVDSRLRLIGANIFQCGHRPGHVGSAGSLLKSPKFVIMRVMIPLSCQMSDALSLKYFLVMPLCGCIELYDVNVWLGVSHSQHFSLKWFSILSNPSDSVGSGAVPATRPEIPTHHQSLINTEFQGFVAGLAWAGAGGAPCSC